MFAPLACRNHLSRGFWDRLGAPPSPWVKDERGSELYLELGGLLASVLQTASFIKCAAAKKRYCIACS